MIALSGIFCGILIGLMIFWQMMNPHIRSNKNDDDELIKKLNRMALDRANERTNPK